MESQQTRQELAESIAAANSLLSSVSENEAATESSESSSQYVGDAPASYKPRGQMVTQKYRSYSKHYVTTVTPTLDSVTTKEPDAVITSNPASGQKDTGSGTARQNQSDNGTTTPSKSSGSASSSSATGSSSDDGSYGFDTYYNPEQQNTSDKWVLNKESKKIHVPSCSDVPSIKPDNYTTSNLSLEELESQGYSRCGHCLD